MIYPYTYSETKIVDDEISASRAGNTGLAYKQDTDQLVVAVFNDANYHSLWLYDRSTLTKDSEIALSTSGTAGGGAIQGVAYNSNSGNFYYSWNNSLYEVEPDGTAVKSVFIGATQARRACFHYYSGWVYYLDPDSSEIKRINSAFTVTEVVVTVPVDQSTLEGLFYDGTHFYMASSLTALDRGHTIIKFDITGAILDTWDTIDDEMEGLVLIEGKLYQCKNRYYHDSISDGNAIWIFNV